MIARLADALSLFRLLAVPVFVWAAATGRQGAFVAVLAASLLSDLVDGTLARWARSASTLGARLDSAGDFATYTSVPICAWLLWPDLIRREAGWVAAVVLSYLIPVLAGFVKFRRLTSYHTWGAKAAAVLLGAGALLLLTGGPTWVFHGAVVVLAVSQVEEVLLTHHLPLWRADVPSLWHARRQGCP